MNEHDCSSKYFDLKRKVSRGRSITHLKMDDGSITQDNSVIIKKTIDFHLKKYLKTKLSPYKKIALFSCLKVHFSTQKCIFRLESASFDQKVHFSTGKGICQIKHFALSKRHNADTNRSHIEWWNWGQELGRKQQEHETLNSYL